MVYWKLKMYSWKLKMVILFSYGMVKDKDIFNKDQISSEEGKRKGSEVGMGENPQMRVIFAKFPLLSKIQTLSHKLLVKQTSNHHHCNQHARKPICWDFQVLLSCSSWSKTTLYILKNIYVFQIACFKKIVESAHMPELNKLKMYSWKLKTVYWRTKDDLLKTNDILLKSKDC